MKTYSRKQVFGRFLIGILIGAALYGSSTAYIDPSSAVSVIGGLVICILQGFGLTFNCLDIIKGFIMPIPIISALIENVKSYYYAVMGILVMLGIKKELTITKKS